MKKILIFSLAIVSLIACTKNESLDKEQKYITLGASIEQTEPTPKATLNGSLETLWASGDMIRVYISNNAGDWHDDIDFELYSGQGTTNGVFRGPYDYSDNNHWDQYAFFPYYYTASGGETNTGTNMGGDGFYFCLPESYYNYTSGQSFLPLLANMSTGGTQPSIISFKHVGAAIVVNLTGVPGAAKSLGLTVADKNIFGWPGKVVLSEVGTANGKIAASDGSNSTVWMNFATADESRSFQFIYPVPTIATTSNLTFTMYDKNNIRIWQKTASNQPAIGRAQALVMPERAVNAIPQNMYLIGYWSGADQETGEAFSNSTGKLTMTFSGDAYVCLRAADTGDWYMTDAYVASGNTATVKPQKGDKLHVPAGTWEFTMTYQTDGSIVITYAAA